MKRVHLIWAVPVGAFCSPLGIAAVAYWKPVWGLVPLLGMCVGLWLLGRHCPPAEEE